jgi:RHH-type transcriptional regulator, rel operon repressor / antitoxin RelB
MRLLIPSPGYRTSDSLAAVATYDTPDMNERQIQEIQSAIAEADAGDFTSTADVTALMDKWSGHSD